MRGLASFTRSTAPSNGMDAQRSAGVPLSSPAAAQRCAEGAGLDSGAAAAAQSAMPSIAPLAVLDRRPVSGRTVARKLGGPAPRAQQQFASEVTAYGSGCPDRQNGAKPDREHDDPPDQGRQNLHCLGS